MQPWIDLSSAFPERAEMAKRAREESERKNLALDPIPLAKYNHSFAVGQRVRIAESHRRGQSTGHTGTIEELGDNHTTVKLDSGHVVHCQDSELEPEGFGHHDHETKEAVTKSAVDPLPLDADDPAPPGDTFAKAAEVQKGRLIGEMCARLNRGENVEVPQQWLDQMQKNETLRSMIAAGRIRPDDVLMNRESRSRRATVKRGEENDGDDGASDEQDRGSGEAPIAGWDAHERSFRD